MELDSDGDVGNDQPERNYRAGLTEKYRWMGGSRSKRLLVPTQLSDPSFSN